MGKNFTDNKETKFNSYKGFQLLLDIIGRQRTNKWNFFYSSITPIIDFCREVKWICFHQDVALSDFSDLPYLSEVS